MSLVNAEFVKTRTAASVRGKVVIGTVEGDTHNIGKDTVAALLVAAGFEVHDLGVLVPASRFFSEAEALGADVVGMSALLSTTVAQQKKVIDYFDDKGKREKYKMIVGGGAVDERWAEEIGADGYAENATEAIKLVEQILGI
jgi:methylmalonyl-CoA mutase cobalamin-binding domain/chain